MAIDKETAIKTIEMLANQARNAVALMAIGHPNPQPTKDHALNLVNTTEELAKCALEVANTEGTTLEPVVTVRPIVAQ
jgi:hypothetical protein